MHFIRRSAFKALTSPSTSFLYKRSITTVSPFHVRQKPQAFVSPIFRRFASDDVGSSERSHDPPTLGSSWDYTSEPASSYASESESASSYASESESASSYASETKDAEYYPKIRRGSGYGLESKPKSSYKPLELTPTSGIYVGNLHFDVTEDQLKREFDEYGNVLTVRIAKDPRGFGKGFAHVEFETVEQATGAIQAKDQTQLEGRRIIVNYTARSSRTVSPGKPTCTLYVGNLAFEMSDADLNTLFNSVENVIDVRVAIDRRTGQPRGFAHAEFTDVESAVKGRFYLSQQTLFGRKLRIDYAEHRPGWSGKGQQLEGGDSSE